MYFVLIIQSYTYRKRKTQVRKKQKTSKQSPRFKFQKIGVITKLLESKTTRGAFTYYIITEGGGCL